jgi:hypothetical protein
MVPEDPQAVAGSVSIKPPMSSTERLDPVTKDWVDITPVPMQPHKPDANIHTPAKPMREGVFYSVDLDRWYDVPLEYAGIVWRATKQLPRILWGFINLWIGVKMGKLQRIAIGITSIIIGVAAIFGFDLSNEVAAAITSVVALIVGLVIPSGTTETK